LAACLAGYKPDATSEVQPLPLPTSARFQSEQVAPTAAPTAPVDQPLFDPSLDLRSGPVAVALELLIPSLGVHAPVQAVGLTAENVMDAPKGPISDAIWSTAFWYRGSGIPGELGIATIAGHVNDPLGVPEIFANLEDLKSGDMIIIRQLISGIDIYFVVEQTKVYSRLEVSDSAVLTLIYGAGPVAGGPAEFAPDGLSHLTLITCAGNIVDGAFDHYTVVYATRNDALALQ
jgi:hypothetical protein